MTNVKLCEELAERIREANDECYKLIYEMTDWLRRHGASGDDIRRGKLIGMTLMRCFEERSGELIKRYVYEGCDESYAPL